MSVAGKTHERDTKAFNLVQQFLGAEFAENSMLVLSHCENLPKDRIDISGVARGGREGSFPPPETPENLQRMENNPGLGKQ